jgi:uncharacterized membrane-anchored protein
MKPFKLTAATVVLAACVTVSLFAQEDAAPRKKPGFHGPASVQLGSVAQLEVPAGYVFLDGKATRAMMETSGEPTSGREVGFLRPTNGEWAVYFEFSDVGYVKDDEKDKLDAVKLLEAIKEGNDEGNKQRERNGNPPLLIVGWEQEPKYDAQTHNLTWAIRATCQGQAILNYNTRLLGRKGVMEAVLVCDPDKLQGTLPTFNGLLGSNYKFTSGETYAEYKPGDKIAKYGLGALVLGGAAVGAAKLGLLGPVILFFKKGWKLLVVAFVAVAASFKKIFARLTGRGGD